MIALETDCVTLNVPCILSQDCIFRQKTTANDARPCCASSFLAFQAARLQRAACCVLTTVVRDCDVRMRVAGDRAMDVAGTQLAYNIKQDYMGGLKLTR